MTLDETFITVIIVSNTSNNKNSAICHQPVEQGLLFAAEGTDKCPPVCEPGAGCKVQLVLRSMKLPKSNMLGPNTVSWQHPEKTVCSD